MHRRSTAEDSARFLAKIGGKFIHSRAAIVRSRSSFLFFFIRGVSFCHLFAKLFLHFPRCPITLGRAGEISFPNLAWFLSRLNLHRLDICVHTHANHRDSPAKTARSNRVPRVFARLRSVHLEIFEIC